MSLLLGIDTGGTYTDAVLVDSASGDLRASYKALTTRHDLALGIARSLSGLPRFEPADVQLVSLSTTLATNAAVEGLGGRVCCVLIGYNPVLLRHYHLDRQIHAAVLEHIPGRHDVFGEEMEQFDVEALRAAIRKHCAAVDAFAISSYLAVRNPEHERRAGAAAAEVTDKPIVLGGDLSRSLNSVRRATTAALNARLIQVIERLLDAVEHTIRGHGIRAPITVVRGDGSLMSIELARSRPVETALSGPAASAVGGHRLTGLDNALVVDMGGTTTDVALLREGRPKLAERGATIGGWRTAVRAADIATHGIGGDSRIVADPLDLNIGPERVTPLALAAASHPSVRERLRTLETDRATHRLLPVWEFLIAGRPPENESLSGLERRALQQLADAPVNVMDLADRLGLRNARLLDVRGLEARGLITRFGLTPTDILHVRGAYTEFDVEAAELACRIAARESRVAPEVFVARVFERVVRRLSTILLRKAVAELEPGVADDEGPLGTFLLDRSASPEHDVDPLDIRLDLTVPLVAIGAPVRAWMPEVAKRLRAELVIPPHAEVANAVGAVSGTVLEEIEILLRPQYARRGITGFTVHTPNQCERFASVDAARAHALRVGPEIARERARRAGADRAIVHTVERSWDAESDEPEGGAYLMETRFVFSAVGRPDFQATIGQTTHSV